MQVAPASLQTLQAFHAMRPKGITMRAQLHAMLDRALIKLAKLLKDTQEIHPWSVPTELLLEGIKRPDMKQCRPASLFY